MQDGGPQDRGEMQDAGSEDRGEMQDAGPEDRGEIEDGDPKGRGEMEDGASEDSGQDFEGMVNNDLLPKGERCRVCKMPFRSANIFIYLYIYIFIYNGRLLPTRRGLEPVPSRHEDDCLDGVQDPLIAQFDPPKAKCKQAGYCQSTREYHWQMFDH